MNDQIVGSTLCLLLAIAYFGGWGFIFSRYGFKWYDIFVPYTAFFRFIEIVARTGWWVIFFVAVPPLGVAFIVNWFLGGG